MRHLSRPGGRSYGSKGLGLFGDGLLALVLAGRLGRQQRCPDPGFDVGGNLRVLLQEGADVFLALADTVVAVAVPGAGLVDDA
jgi:hypothetical protein